MPRLHRSSAALLAALFLVSAVHAFPPRHWGWSWWYDDVPVVVPRTSETLPVPSGDKKPKPPATVTVYVTPRGEKYHREDCHFLWKGSDFRGAAVELNDAKRAGRQEDGGQQKDPHGKEGAAEAASG